jgi:hypothetical protein
VDDYLRPARDLETLGRGMTKGPELVCSGPLQSGGGSVAGAQAFLLYQR